MTASTGIAAKHIGGVTIHSWAGIRLGTGAALTLAETIRKRAEEENAKALLKLGNEFDEHYEYYKPLRNWLTTQVLVIDESM